MGTYNGRAVDHHCTWQEATGHATEGQVPPEGLLTQLVVVVQDCSHLVHVATQGMDGCMATAQVVLVAFGRLLDQQEATENLLYKMLP